MLPPELQENYIKNMARILPGVKKNRRIYRQFPTGRETVPQGRILCAALRL